MPTPSNHSLDTWFIILSTVEHNVIAKLTLECLVYSHCKGEMVMATTENGHGMVYLTESGEKISETSLETVVMEGGKNIVFRIACMAYAERLPNSETLIQDGSMV